MAKRVQLIRHDSAGAAAFLGKQGELTVNTTKNVVIVHNGTTTGGYEQARADLNNVNVATAASAGKMSATQASQVADHESTIPTKADKVVPSAANNIALLDASGNLVDGGRPFFDAGTAAVFYQAAAPTGWTGSDAHNDKALRIVTVSGGSGGGNGGTHDLSSPPSTAHTHAVGTYSVDNHTLSISEIPAHNHGNGTLATASNGAHVHTLNSQDSGGSSVRGVQVEDSVSVTAESGLVNSNGAHTHTITGSTANNGGGGSHNHGLSGSSASNGPTAFAPKYIDVIVATRDA